MAFRIIALIALLLAGTIACSPTDTDDPAEIPVKVVVIVEGTPTTEELADTAHSAASENSIFVNGTIRIPSPCHADLHATGIRTENDISLAITSTRTGSSCDNTPAAVDYRASAAELSAGTRVVTVHHGSGEERRVVSVDTVVVKSQPTAG